MGFLDQRRGGSRESFVFACHFSVTTTVADSVALPASRSVCACVRALRASSCHDSCPICLRGCITFILDTFRHPVRAELDAAAAAGAATAGQAPGEAEHSATAVPVAAASAQGSGTAAGSVSGARQEAHEQTTCVFQSHALARVPPVRLERACVAAFLWLCQA